MVDSEGIPVREGTTATPAATPMPWAALQVYAKSGREVSDTVTTNYYRLAGYVLMSRESFP